MATWVGHPGVDLNYAVKLDNPENHRRTKNYNAVLLTCDSLSNF